MIKGRLFVVRVVAVFGKAIRQKEAETRSKGRAASGTRANSEESLVFLS